MKLRVTFILALGSAMTLPAQAPTNAVKAHTSDLGFSYGLPSDWQVVDSQATLPQVKEQAAEKAGSDEEKRGVQCVQMALTARKGNPPSVIVVVAMPFDCFGQTMTEQDLPGFASGASEGLKRTFDLGEPVSSNYELGGHKMWVERAKGTPQGQTAPQYTIEVACGLLKKAAVCWMTMAAADADLAAFEKGPVALDGGAPAALVPTSVYAVKP